MSDGTGAASADRTAMNSRRAERRREVTRTVQSVREQLASTNGMPPAFYLELYFNHARSQMSAALIKPLVITLLGVAANLWTSRLLITMWAIIAITGHVTSLFFYRRFLSLIDQKIVLASWRWRFIFLDGISGFTLGMLFVLPSLPNVGTDVFQFSAMLILIAFLSLLSTNVPGSMIASSLPITASISFEFTRRAMEAQAHSGDHLYVLAGMALTVEMFFILIGFRLYQANIAQISAKSEKDSLIADLEQANAISDESRRKAEEANLAKSRFLATMSHELRTPLNAILGFSEVMQNELMGPLDNATYKGYITDIHDSGRHLLNLINEILDLSRIEAGRYTLNEEAVTLPYIVEDCAHMMNLRARNKGVTLQEQYEDFMPKIWGDERAIRQIALNLMSNAVKFTPNGGTITVKVGWTAGGGQYVSVKDTGPGISEEELPIVLQAFGQGSLAIKSAEQGTGLGLNIVQALVAMHGGTFDLKSKLREGTEAIFTIPQTRVMEIMPAISERPRRRSSGMMLPMASVQMLEGLRRQSGGRS
jgi:two-component system cell cycle sensor histidine kinase PleC